MKNNRRLKYPRQHLGGQVLLYFSMPNCSFTFLTASIEIESQSLCDYVNYHVFMFFVCSTLSGLSLLPTIIILARNGVPPSREQIRARAKWALLLLCHASGFDGVLVCVVSVVLLYVLLLCFHNTCKALSLVLRAVSVSPMVVQIVVAGDCTICLESTGDGEKWFAMQCGHTFHVDCLAKWRQGTCPLCRAVYE